MSDFVLLCKSHLENYRFGIKIIVIYLLIIIQQIRFCLSLSIFAHLIVALFRAGRCYGSLCWKAGSSDSDGVGGRGDSAGPR